MVNNDGVINLRDAIITQAIQDYIEIKLRLEKSFDELQELQDFFTGGQFELYNETGLTGADVMRNADIIVEEKLKKWRRKRQKEMAV